MEITIPIIIDAVKQSENFNFSRCSFFSIECDELTSPVSEHQDIRSIPFYQSNVASMPRVIFKPMDGSPLFDSVKKIDDLFDLVEYDDSFYIDTNDIWIPNTFFNDSSRPHPSGEDLFRIPGNVFDAALWARDKIFNQDWLLNTCSAHSKGARYEPLETKAFQDWGEQHIREASDQYHANRSKYLADNDYPSSKQ